jgi:hypothetical protein
MPENEVMIDPKKLRQSEVETAEKVIEVKELNRLMGLEDGEVAVLKIRQLDLDEYLRCKMRSDDKVRNIIEGAIAAAEKMGEFEEEVFALYKEMNPQSKYYIDICMAGVIEPKMTRPNWVFLAKRFPMALESIAAQILLLTKGGASLKKNSSS